VQPETEDGKARRHFHTRDETLETRMQMNIAWALYRCHCGYEIGWRRVRGDRN
jgi:hypothetical protein